jgi:ERF superfamily
MTAEPKTVDYALVPDGYPATLEHALAMFQAKMKPIAKTETGEVEGVSKATGKAFKYTYTYADLAGISEVAMPILGEFGLSFSAKPTTLPAVFDDKGNQVLPVRQALVYKLMHVSGDFDEGEWPLRNPVQVTPQSAGSDITYARRYCFVSITGIATKDDDDAAAASAQKAPVEDERAGFYPDQGDEEAARSYEQDIADADSTASLTRIAGKIAGDRRLTREQRAKLKQQYDARYSVVKAAEDQAAAEGSQDQPPLTGDEDE